MRVAVFLDRDNTLIHNDGDLGDPAKVVLLQGAASAVASLCGLGYRVIVVTNQGGVARGVMTEADVQAVNDRLASLLLEKANGARIDAFYYCPCHPEGTVDAYRREHPDRKPQPGMLLRAAEDFQLDLSHCWMVGDSPRDIEAGHGAGCRTILLTPQARQVTPLHADQQSRSYHQRIAAGEVERDQPEFTASRLIEAVRIIAQQRKPEPEEYRRKLEALERRREHEINLRGPSDNTPPDDTAPHPDVQPAVTNRPAGQVYQPDPENPPFRPWSMGLHKPQPRASTQPSSVPKQPAAPPSVNAPPAPSQSAPPSAVAATVPSTPPAPPPPAAASPPTTREPNMEKLLEQILTQLRRQHHGGEHFNALTIVALVLQAIAALCLLGALWMGSGNLDLFMRWMGAGLLIQIAVIAALMFSSRMED